MSMVCRAGSGCDRLTLWAQTKEFDHMAGDAIAGGLFKPGNNSLQATVVEALDNAALCTYQMMAVPAAQTVPMAIVQTMDALEHAKVAQEADGAKDTGDSWRLVAFDQPLLDFLNAECAGSDVIALSTARRGWVTLYPAAASCSARVVTAGGSVCLRSSRKRLIASPFSLHSSVSLPIVPYAGC